MEEESLVKFDDQNEKKENKPNLHELVRKIGELLKDDKDENLEDAMKLVQELEERMKSGG